MPSKSRQDRPGGPIPEEAGESGRGIVFASLASNKPVSRPRITTIMPRKIQERESSPGIIAILFFLIFMFAIVFSTCVDCVDRLSMAEDRWQSQTERGAR